MFQSDAMARIFTVHPSNIECVYLRLLSINVRGPQSFQDLRTVDGVLCATQRRARTRTVLKNSVHSNKFERTRTEREHAIFESNQTLKLV